MKFKEAVVFAAGGRVEAHTDHMVMKVGASGARDVLSTDISHLVIGNDVTGFGVAKEVGLVGIVDVGGNVTNTSVTSLIALRWVCRSGEASRKRASNRRSATGWYRFRRVLSLGRK